MDERLDEWLRGSGPDQDVVICTRVRFARNVEGHPFSTSQSEEASDELVREVGQALAPLVADHAWRWVDLREVQELDRRALVERHLISRELDESDRARAVAFDDEGACSLMINEEDHLRLQVFRSGLRMEEAWQAADEVDDEMSKLLPYAFSDSFGFLTSCPTNTGTGLRISVLMHLPALVTAKEIDKATNAIHEMNMAVRGLYGEGSHAVGDLFQISNQRTLGQSEEEILRDLESAVRSLIEFEKRQREEFLQNRVFIADRAWRALGVLERARTISSEETMNLLSRIRLGRVLGVLDEPPLEALNSIFLLSQPAHLQRAAGKRLDENERDALRADRIRDILSGR